MSGKDFTAALELSISALEVWSRQGAVQIHVYVTYLYHQIKAQWPHLVFTKQKWEKVERLL